MNSKRKGDYAMMRVMAALAGKGWTVLLPISEDTRYDLVFDDGERLARVQCKAGRLRGGVVRFNTASRNGVWREVPARRSYEGQIEFYGVYCPDTDHVYLVPIEDMPTCSEGSLRVETALNGQSNGVRLAETYLVPG